MSNEVKPTITEEQEELLKLDFFLKRPNSQEELRDWFSVYLGLTLPDSHLLDEGSNTSPMEAVWTSFESYIKNKGDIEPGYIWLSSRDSMKTLGASMLATALMVFCDATICWLASIEPQSKIALNNIQSFIQRLNKYLTHHGKNVESNNARNLEIVADDGSRSLINILVATMASVNGRHVNIVMTDEVDLVRDPKVLDEVQAVASLIGGQFPLKVYFSTRKFSWGNMETIIEKSEDLGLKILKWDILDVTEHCGIERRLSNEKTESIYIHPEPPMRSAKQEDFDKMLEPEQKQYQKIQVFPGCVGCKLVSQCKTRLGDRSPKDKGKLWKKIDHTINMFRSMSPDMASAQLLCKKPSLSGLVYPRFSELDNLLNLDAAYAAVMGEVKTKTSHDDLVSILKSLGVEFHIGVDWGSTAAQAFVVTALLPSGDWWIIESYAITEMEFDEILELGKKIRDKYLPRRWYADTNQPIFRKAFAKNGMKTVDFKKDVSGGIECVRGRVIDSFGKRRLKIIVDPENPSLNKTILLGFKRHHFKTDGVGKPTNDPDDGELWSDVMDALRYIAQNIFSAKGQKPVAGQTVEPYSAMKQATYANPAETQVVSGVNTELMRHEIAKHATQPSGHIGDSIKKNKKIFWNSD